MQVGPYNRSLKERRDSTASRAAKQQSRVTGGHELLSVGPDTSNKEDVA
jgi:hypothetical protein